MHYPGMVTPASAMEVVNRTGKPVFASEDYGVYFDASGGKAWARLLNQNAVRGYMSGTIAWNLGETRSLFLLSQFPCEKRCYKTGSGQMCRTLTPKRMAFHAVSSYYQPYEDAYYGPR